MENQKVKFEWFTTTDFINPVEVHYEKADEEEMGLLIALYERFIKDKDNEQHLSAAKVIRRIIYKLQ